jgi:hypothetical protein
MSSGAEAKQLEFRPWKCPQRIPLSPSVCISSSSSLFCAAKNYSFSAKNYFFVLLLLLLLLLLLFSLVDLLRHHHLLHNCQALQACFDLLLNASLD